MRSILISILCFGCAAESATPTPGVDGSVEQMPDAMMPVPTPDAASCTLQGTQDDPDSEFTDSNCDGIDGNAAISVFLAPIGDDAGDGTREHPLRTYAHAVQFARAHGKTAILASIGEYGETVAVAEGIALHGGYDPLHGWQRTHDAHTVFRAAGPVLIATNIQRDTRVTFVDFRATAAAAGETSIGARI